MARLNYQGMIIWTPHKYIIDLMTHNLFHYRVAILFLTLSANTSALADKIKTFKHSQTPTTPYEDLLQHRSGYAQHVTGGAGGEVITLKTTHLDDFIKAVSGKSPRWIRFSPGLKGEIDFSNKHLVIGSNKTIDGRDADITFTAPVGCSELQFWGKSNEDPPTNLIIHNVTFKKIGTGNNCGVAISIAFGAHLVWVDHVTFTNIGDESLTLGAGAYNLTSSWNRFINTEKATLGSWNDETSVNRADEVITLTSHHNYFSNTNRTPLLGYGKAHQYNNIIRDWTWGAAQIRQNGQLLSENNIYDNPKSSIAAIATSGGCATSEGDIFIASTLQYSGACINTKNTGYIPPYPYTLEKPNSLLIQNLQRYTGRSNNPQWIQSK